MISGALLLGKEESIIKILKKRVCRFLLVLILFTYLQTIIERKFCVTGLEFISIFKNMLANPVKTSYWYLYSYISFLVMLPFTRKIAQQLKEEDFLYLLILGIIFKDCFLLLCKILKIGNINVNIYISSMNIFFPLLGYYLDKYQKNILRNYKWFEKMLLVGTIFGIASAVFMTYYSFLKTNEWKETYISLFNTISAIWFFTFINKKVSEIMPTLNKTCTDRVKKILEFASGTMFGIYLLEDILKKCTQCLYTILAQYIPSVFACIIWLIATMLLGICIIGMLKRKISIVRKLI